MIKILNENTNYWLVRTAGGVFYEQFVAKNYIAVGWNEISNLDSFREAKDDEAVKEKLLKTIRDYVEKEQEKEEKPKGEREREAQKSRIYNQINRFVNEMAEGDYILIPSPNSNLIEFGIISSNAYIETLNIVDMEEGDCDFLKRRKVTWLYREKRDRLDPYLYKLLNSQHAISSANDYAHYIDRTINRFYVKNKQAHLILDVEKESNISTVDFVTLMSSVLSLIDTFNNVTGSQLSKNDVQIKANIQSPGIIELFGSIGIIAIIATVYCSIFGGKVSLFKMFEFETKGVQDAIRQYIELFQKHNLEKEKLELQRATQSLNVKFPPELQTDSQEGTIEKKND